uniref:Uncharacterized protein n=1 Tax=Octactis speculum TaxID=3111310 RepID=A0A7S2DB51_9STRA
MASVVAIIMFFFFEAVVEVCGLSNFLLKRFLLLCYTLHGGAGRKGRVASRSYVRVRRCNIAQVGRRDKVSDDIFISKTNNIVNSKELNTSRQTSGSMVFLIVIPPSPFTTEASSFSLTFTTLALS